MKVNTKTMEWVRAPKQYSITDEQFFSFVVKT